MHPNNNNISLSDEIKKSVSINEILDRFGISHPNKSDYKICTPWRVDSDPSLHVFIGGDGIWKWYDFGTGENGSVIDAYMRLSGQREFKEAVKEIKNGLVFPSKPIFSINQEPKPAKKKIVIDKVFPYVASQPLQNHLRIYRGFPIPLYNEYLREIHFHIDYDLIEGKTVKSRFGFGMACNDGQDWNIRTCFREGNNKWSGSGFTMINNGFARLVIFEGMCDMLAFIALFPWIQADFMILNGVHNSNKALEYLNNLEWPYISVGLALDNDKNGSGQRATQEMLKGLPDYPYRFSEMARKWLEEHADASEEERKCYERCTKCGNVDLVPWIWEQFPQVKTCKDVCEVWQRVSYRESWRRERFKSCEVCQKRELCNTKRGNRIIFAQVCRDFKRM